MAHISLKRIGIEKDILERLTRCHILSCHDLLKRNVLEVQKLVGLSLAAVNNIFLKASHHIAPKAENALELWKKRQEVGSVLKTSLDLLDGVLHGGIPVGTITEIAGPSGCGKTQFSIMLSVIGTLPQSQGGLNGAVIYIDTESAFSAERLVEIAESRYPEQFNTEESLFQLTSRIHISNVSTCAVLLQRLESLEEDIISKGVKVVILDSVASLVRKEFDSRTGSNMAERTKLLSKQAALLKYIAETFNIPIVVTNQITTRFGSEVNFMSHPATEMEDGEQNLEGESGYVTAALGNTWSHCVNTRLIVQYLDGARRQVLVAKSPVAPFATFIYRIDASGIQLERGGAEHYEGTDPGLQKIRVRTSLRQTAFQY